MFLVIDGSSMLSSNYYGSLPHEVKIAKTDEEKADAYKLIMQTSNGTYTNGVYSSLRMVLDIIHNFPKITHMAIVFDKSRNTFRRKIDPNYKAQRKPTPSPLSEQFITMENILREIGLKVFVDDTFEADDIAGSIIETFKTQTHMIFMTKDHDYLQLIDNNVTGWIVMLNQVKADVIMAQAGITNPNVPSKVALFNTDVVMQEEGVLPHQIPDLKGLCGDSSDNIPGVAGIGPKVAIPLLAHYGSIENIYKTIEQPMSKENLQALNKTWKDYGIKRSPYKHLSGQKDIALMSKNLATIRKTYPVPDNIENYRINIDQKALMSVIQKYEMNSLITYTWQ